MPSTKYLHPMKLRESELNMKVGCRSSKAAADLEEGYEWKLERCTVDENGVPSACDEALQVSSFVASSSSLC